MTEATRVLVVDDDVLTRVGVRTILSSEPGFEVVGEAATGTEAVELAAALKPDVVLLGAPLHGWDSGAVERVLLVALDLSAQLLGEQAEFHELHRLIEAHRCRYRARRGRGLAHPDN